MEEQPGNDLKEYDASHKHEAELEDRRKLYGFGD